MQTRSTWKVCRSCAQQWHLPIRREARKSGSFRRFSTAKPLRKAPWADSKAEVHFYEQTGRNKKNLLPISEEQFNDVSIEAAQIKARIKSLEEQLRIVESGKDLDKLSPDELALLTRAEEGRSFTKEELQDLFKDDEDAIEHAEALGIDPDELDLEKLEFQLPPAQRESLERLTRLLQEVSLDPVNTKKRRWLWQQYMQCKSQLPGFQDQMPKNAWEVLWQSQYGVDTADDSRSKHLWLLADDIARSGLELGADQKMVRIEGRVARKKYDEALTLWEEYRDELSKSDRVAGAFKDIGPSILAALKRPSEAQVLAFEVSMVSPRVSTFLPVIEAWLQQGTKSANGKAWWLYLKIRELVKEQITPEDYDRLVMTFFRNGQTHLALAVFKDLVVAGRKSDFDSLELKKKSGQLFKELGQQAQDTASVNSFSLTSLAVLPKSFQNKYFYAMWMKRLIGLQEIEAAASVLELMYLRGVRADPIHLNGLISALIRRGRSGDKRTGRLSDKELALETGWSMIRERLKFVARRRALDEGRPPSPVEDDPDARLPPYLGKNLPPATIETFAVMLLYYTRSNMITSVEKLHSALAEAELQPNIYYLNHLLYMHLRRGDTSTVWSLFTKSTNNTLPSASDSGNAALTPASTSLSSSPSLTPDMATFTCLWDACKAHVSSNPLARRAQFSASGVHFPGARTLFAHTTHWLSSIPPRSRDAAIASFSADLYTQIVRCFALTRDLPGAYVALHALRELFGRRPGAEDVRLVCIQLARSSEPERGGWKRRRVGRFGDNAASQAQLERVAAVLESLEREREAQLKERYGEQAGMSVEKLSEEAQGDERLWLLASLLKAVMEGKRGAKSLRTGGEDGKSEREVAEEVEKVAWRMGVGGLTVGAPMYEVVSGTLRPVGLEGEICEELVD